jgi:hypothetical protein
MNTVCSSETYNTTRHHNPEDQHRHIHRRENLRSQIITFTVQSGM